MNSHWSTFKSLWRLSPSSVVVGLGYVFMYIHVPSNMHAFPPNRGAAHWGWPMPKLKGKKWAIKHGYDNQPRISAMSWQLSEPVVGTRELQNSSNLIMKILLLPMNNFRMHVKYSSTFSPTLWRNKRYVYPMGTNITNGLHWIGVQLDPAK
jgi:hypothetical protein